MPLADDDLERLEMLILVGLVAVRATPRLSQASPREAHARFDTCGFGYAPRVGGPIDLKPGDVFAGDYCVEKPIKVGGMGAVYLVTQVSTNLTRALKVMLPEVEAHTEKKKQAARALHADKRKRFELEAKIGAAIKSEHVIKVIQAGVDEKTNAPWIVMEFLDGEDLNEYTERTGPLPPDEVREIFDQICDAIGEMHELGIVHRDLKLENIYRARDKPRRMSFLIKVLDLGIARVIAAADAKTASSKTKPGLGSSYWMAPEQVKPDQKIDARTDVWALGLIAFRLLTGQSFWKSETVYGATPLAWIAESCIEELAGASERAAELECEALLPPGFDAWFAKCVNQDVEQRYANASVMFAAIEYWFVTVPAPSSIEEGPATDPMLEPPLGLLDEQRRLQVKTLAELPAKEAVEQPTHPMHVVDVREPDMLKPSAIEPGGGRRSRVRARYESRRFGCRTESQRPSSQRRGRGGILHGGIFRPGCCKRRS